MEKVAWAIAADKEFLAAACAALGRKLSVLAESRGPVKVTKASARSVMKFYDGDLYGAAAALEEAGLEE